MESVGELLRKEREAQGKTIEDVVRITKMSSLIIKALEGDHFSALPAPVYVKGHLRTYARFLGLNEDAVVEKYLRFTQQQEHEELDEWDEIELELHEEKQRVGRRWVWVAGAAAVVVALLVWYAIAQRGGGDGGADAGGGPVAVPSQQQEPAEEETTSEAAAEDTMIEWYRLKLTAVARERTWLRVSVDGVAVADLTLNRGEQREWEAEEYFELDVGNGGGLDLYLGGEFLGTAGAGSRLVEGLVVNEDGMSR
jgi:cytoskeletal protein RodZ